MKGDPVKNEDDFTSMIGRTDIKQKSMSLLVYIVSTFDYTKLTMPIIYLPAEEDNVADSFC